LRADRRSFVLFGLTPDVQKIFRISGFDKILAIHDTRADAIAFAGG
jgi:anti-anti-sigma regulatory factor